MDETPKRKSSSGLLAIMTMLLGIMLTCLTVPTLISYLALSFNDDWLGAQLGQMAAIWLGGICAPLLIYHSFQSLRRRPSRPLSMPKFYLFWIAFGLVLGLGNLLLTQKIATNFIFPLFFWLGAALPTLAVLSWASMKLGWPISWRQGVMALAVGSTLSILIAIMLEMALPMLMYFFLDPTLGFISDFFRTLDPSGGELNWLIFFMIFTALQAPIPEEFAKAIGLPIFGRQRIQSEKQAFMIGLWAGAGFAILENMLYEGLYAQWSGWTWGGVTLLRGLGSILHPLCTGLVALGWYRARERGWGYALKMYGASVGLHTLWNGGFMPLVYWTGLTYFIDIEISFYGEAIPALLVAYLLLLTAGLWWLLIRLVKTMQPEIVDAVIPATAVTPRAIAAWAFACALIIIPIGAALGPAWSEIERVLLMR